MIGGMIDNGTTNNHGTNENRFYSRVQMVILWSGCVYESMDLCCYPLPPRLVFPPYLHPDDVARQLEAQPRLHLGPYDHRDLAEIPR